MTQLGAVTATLKADAGPWVSETQRAAKALGDVKASAYGLGSDLVRTTKQNEDLLKSLNRTSYAAKQNETAAKALSSTTQTTGIGAGQLKERIEKVNGAVNAFSGALVGSSGEVGKFGAAISNVFGAAAAGGGIGVAIAAAATGLSLLVQHFGAISAAAETASDDAKKKLEDLRTEVQNLDDALKALGRGVDVNRIVAEREVAEKATAARAKGESFISTYGDAAGPNGEHIEDFRAMADVSESAKKVVDAFDETVAAGTELGLAQKKLADIVAASQMKQHLDDEAKAADAAKQAAGAAKTAVADLAGEIADHVGKGATSLDEWTPFAKWAPPPPSMAVGAPIISDLSAPIAKLRDGVSNTNSVFARTAKTVDEFMTVSERAGAAFAKAGDAVHDFFSRDNFEQLTSAILSGHGGHAAGQQVGALVGGIVDVASGGATGGAGAALGGILGGLFGDALDKLVNALGVLTPLFDGIGLVIDGLTPILMVLRETFESLMPVWELLGLIIKQLARPLAELLRIVIQIGVGPLIFLAEVVLELAAYILQVVEVITWAAKVLETHVIKPIINFGTQLYNLASQLFNATQIATHGGRGGDRIAYQDEVGGGGDGHHSRKDDFEEAKQRAIEKQRAATEKNTDALNAFNHNVRNLPGYKGVPGAEFAAGGDAPHQVFIFVGGNATSADLRRAEQFARDGTTTRTLMRRGILSKKN